MLNIYRCLTFFLFPLILIIIYLRSFFNKEDKYRYKEKIFSSFFKANRNNNKKLFWFHVASIGELLSILPLIEEINFLNKNIEFLITTVTLSSANLLKKKLHTYSKINITHRFFPLDVWHLSNNFLNEWKPDLVCFVDSEIWPNFLFDIKKKKIPLVLINGRVTKKTFNRWNIFPNFARKVFDNFDLCLACSNNSNNNLKRLKVRNLHNIGNLKFSVKIKKENLSDASKKVLDNFKVWCAASTHEGEEMIILESQLEIKKIYKNILTIIIPRHINRISRIKKLTDKFNLKSQILNGNDVIDGDREILIINSFGVLFEYFNYCKNIFIGKSLIKKLELVGGQNPIEAAKHGCRIYHGPYVYNFKEVYDFFKSNGISEQINDGKDLAEKIIVNFRSSEEVNNQNLSFLSNYGDKILKQTIEELNKLSIIKNENL